ncbi:MAG: hypothetical protein GXP16_10995 [Gammaproteobacteria bacterium]|nr:hypothetical protein [Gammaproteobacteria bacterium]
MSWWKILLIVVGVLTLGGIGVAWYVINHAELDMYVPLYVENCGQCHGDVLQGTEKGVALLGAKLHRGDDVTALQHSIKNAHPNFGRPAFAQVLSDEQIKGLAIYIGERRMGQRFTQFQFDREVNIPSAVQSSEEHNFKIETVIEGLDPLIFSIEPLPDGSWLLTEKERGLSIVSRDGVQSALLEGTPEMGGSVDIMGVQYGSGWLLDVAIHPDYETNGWIYLHYTDLCAEQCDSSIMSASMNRLDRGRIVNGQWVDVQTIWRAPWEFYVATPDTGAGGRIAFDDSGHVYISVGIKSADGTADTTPQDLDSPYGKIHRVRDDGTIPLDNPFVVGGDSNSPQTNFVRKSIWTYGHRSQQGLEWHPTRKRVWNSEMGPRGGDELNELLPGRNYGWPYFSLGLEYAGSQVERHKPKSIEFDRSQVEQTLVDITPSPAISSFVIYSGSRFAGWQENVLIGSLKGSSLFRMVFEGKNLVHRETLIKDLARIRDVEVGFDGLVYLLLENKAGSTIVKLVPSQGGV